MKFVTDRVGGMADEYADAGEFLDVLSGDAWAVLRSPVVAALAGADPSAGPLVDLGAGSGRGTRILAGLHTDATVLAVEPSPVQRAVLAARLMDDLSMAARVTLVAERAEAAELPDRLGGVLAMNMIGHLDPAARRDLWRRIAGRLAPGAPLVVNVQPPARAEVVPESEFTWFRSGVTATSAVDVPNPPVRRPSCGTCAIRCATRAALCGEKSSRRTGGTSCRPRRSKRSSPRSASPYSTAITACCGPCDEQRTAGHQDMREDA